MALSDGCFLGFFGLILDNLEAAPEQEKTPLNRARTGKSRAAAHAPTKAAKRCRRQKRPEA
jgi:hypothetical protein